MSRSTALSRDQAVIDAVLRTDLYAFVQAIFPIVSGGSELMRNWHVEATCEDVDRGRISINSPIAQALIGEKKGSKIEVVAPAGLKAYQVKKVEWTANAR